MFTGIFNLFLRKQYWQRQQLKEFSQRVASILDRDNLLYSILAAIIQILHIHGGMIFYWNEHKKIYELKFAQGNINHSADSLSPDTALVYCLQNDREEIIFEEIEKKYQLFWTQIKLREEFNYLNCCLALPLVFREKLLGILLLNKKDSGKPYTPADLDLLLMMAGESAIALENAELFSRLQTEKEKMETIFNGIGDGVVLTDTRFNVLTMNPASRAFLKLNETSLGKNLAAELKEFEFSLSFEEIGEEKNNKCFPYTIVRKQPKLLILDCNTTRIFSDEDIPVGYVSLFRDVTEQKKEEGVKQAFLSLISHKLRTPLVPLLGYAPLLLQGEEAEKLSAFQKKAIQSIARQSEILVNLVDKLISFSTLEDRHSVFRFDWCNLNLLLTDILGKGEEYFKKQRVKIIIDESVVQGVLVFVDKERIREVFFGLIENAIKFNNKEDKIVKISAVANDENFIKVVITDNGSGIPREEWERIFLKFYQLERNFTGQVSGLGLGLYVAKKIVESMGGKIWLESEIGKGSSFFFLLPIKQNISLLPNLKIPS